MSRVTSWRRRSLTSLGRRLTPILKPTAAASAADPDVPHMPVVFNDSILPVTAGLDVPQLAPVFNDSKADPQTPYNKPIELIREEEYPHMNQGSNPSSP